jgi:hypothetical protein
MKVQFEGLLDFGTMLFRQVHPPTERTGNEYKDG